MSKENHDKFIAELRDVRMQIEELEERAKNMIENRNIVDHLYIEERPDLYNDQLKYEYLILAPTPEGYSLSTCNIVEICKMTKVNRKSLKKIWVDQIGGRLAQVNGGETVIFKNNEDAKKALEWLISRLMIKKLSK